MKPTDPEHERQRLLEEYSNMADAQLKEIAADEPELTEMARRALKDEMERRGLHVDWEPVPVADQWSHAPDTSIVTIRIFKSLDEANLAMGLLEACGIECFTADANMARLETAFAFGIRLQVKEEDAEAANEILDQPVQSYEEDDS